jgi:cell division protein FtsW (lipid II flippase)
VSWGSAAWAIGVALVAGGGAVMTGLALPDKGLDAGVDGAVALGALALGAWLGRRVPLWSLAMPLGLLALLASVLLFATPLGVEHHGALRHLEVGLRVQPAALWVLAALVSAAATFGVERRAGWWLALACAGGVASSVAMPELSILPQLAAGLAAVGWFSGERRLVWAPVLLSIAAIALTPVLPYVKRRWLGWLDPDAYRLGAGHDYLALGRALQKSAWWGQGAGPEPRLSSPGDDYWLVYCAWRLGRVPVIAWLCGLGACLGTAPRVARAAESPPGLLARALVAALGIALVIHAGYNLGLWPVTAVNPPLAGLGGTAAACQLFGLGLAWGGAARD